MNDDLRALVRGAGYETLFWAAGILGSALHPTQRNVERLHGWILKKRSRQQSLERLRGRGLVELQPGKAPGALRLTGLGRLVLAGGRDPESAWGREWDGRWHLLVFDLPQEVGRARMKFWRWLRANHFGLLQQSVWVSPDPVPAVDKLVAESGFPATSVMVFTGGIGAGMRPRQIAENAWDFPEINVAYRRYLVFADDTLREIRQAPVGGARLEKILRQDRALWGEAAQADPLLPKALLPRDYEGKSAWKQRQRLHKELWKRLPGSSP